MENKELKPTKGYEKMPLQIIVHLQSIETRRQVVKEIKEMEK